eukprot:365659-Chlamydomonas_euryale.AAC.4
MQDARAVTVSRSDDRQLTAIRTRLCNALPHIYGCSRGQWPVAVRSSGTGDRPRIRDRELVATARRAARRPREVLGAAPSAPSFGARITARGRTCTGTRTRAHAPPVVARVWSWHGCGAADLHWQSRFEFESFSKSFGGVGRHPRPVIIPDNKLLFN